MKQLNQNGIGALVGLVIIVVIAVIGFTGWQVMKKDEVKPPTTSTPTPPVNNDCGDDRQCFYQAYSDNCLPKTLKVTRTTVEGDPINTTAKISNSNQACLIEVTVDGSQDKFGDSKIHTYSCKKLAQAKDQKLTAGECTGTTETSSIDI